MGRNNSMQKGLSERDSPFLRRCLLDLAQYHGGAAGQVNPEANGAVGILHGMRQNGGVPREHVDPRLVDERMAVIKQDHLRSFH